MSGRGVDFLSDWVDKHVTNAIRAAREAAAL
jgi:hypothetical protein